MYDYMIPKHEHWTFNAGLVGSCNALNSQLQKLGSKLLILEGKPSEALPRLAKALNSDLIITEEEVEYGYGNWTYSPNHKKLLYTDST